VGVGELRTSSDIHIKYIDHYIMSARVLSVGISVKNIENY